MRNDLTQTSVSDMPLFYLALILIVASGWVSATAKLHLRPEYRAKAFSVRGQLLDFLSTERYTPKGRQWLQAGRIMALAGPLIIFGELLFSPQ